MMKYIYADALILAAEILTGVGCAFLALSGKLTEKATEILVNLGEFSQK